MSLKGRLSHEFAGRIRDRGVAYFRSNAVQILEHSKSHVDARVKGSKGYLVRLTLGRVSLDVACTCPYFEKGEECKHVWATMLAADSRQYLTDVDARTRLNLRVDDEAVAELRELAGIQDSHVDNGHYGQVIPFRSTPPRTNQQAPAGEAKTPQEPQPVWKRRLSLITSAVKADPLAEADELAFGAGNPLPRRPGSLTYQRQTHSGGLLPRTNDEG